MNFHSIDGLQGLAGLHCFAAGLLLLIRLLLSSLVLLVVVVSG